MKVTAYLRVGIDREARTVRGRQPKVAANAKPTTRPLDGSDGNPCSTVAFAVELNIPDGLFAQAEQVIAELTIREDQAVIAATVVER